MTLRKRSRLRRILKWAGVVFCVLLLVFWVGVNIRPFGFRVDPYYIYCWEQKGIIFWGYGRETITLPKSLPYEFVGVDWQRGFTDGSLLPRAKILWIGSYYSVVPYWLPFSLVSVPTLLLFWRDRRIPPGHCHRCGYNLTGNVSGICSECGEPCEAEARAT